MTRTLVLQSILGHPQTTLTVDVDRDLFRFTSEGCRERHEHVLLWNDSQVGVYSIRRVFVMLVAVAGSPDGVVDIDGDLGDELSFSDGFRGFWWTAFVRRRQGRVRLILHIEDSRSARIAMLVGFAEPEELRAFAGSIVMMLDAIDEERSLRELGEEGDVP